MNKEKLIIILPTTLAILIISILIVIVGLQGSDDNSGEYTGDNNNTDVVDQSSYISTDKSDDETVSNDNLTRPVTVEDYNLDEVQTEHTEVIGVDLSTLDDMGNAVLENVSGIDTEGTTTDYLLYEVKLAINYYYNSGDLTTDSFVIVDISDISEDATVIKFKIFDAEGNSYIYEKSVATNTASIVLE